MHVTAPLTGVFIMVSTGEPGETAQVMVPVGAAAAGGDGRVANPETTSAVPTTAIREWRRRATTISSPDVEANLDHRPRRPAGQRTIGGLRRAGEGTAARTAGHRSCGRPRPTTAGSITAA